MDNFLAAAILGLIEGVTEFIPVSSTGHLLLAEHWLGVKQGQFLAGELFNSFIQVWAMLAALPLFHSRLAALARWRERGQRDYFIKLGTAFAVTAIGGGVMKKCGLELPDEPMPILVALAVGGVLFIAVERWLRGRQGGMQITWTVAVAVGFAQLAAVAFPGTSRSGVTILLALLLGLSRPAATEFSFLLGVPTLGAAGAKTLYDAWKSGAPIEWALLGVASVASAISSVFAVRWMIRYVQTHTFTGFGWYRIGLAVLLFVLLKTGLA